jgi:CheY-like chemotaxis protein
MSAEPHKYRFVMLVDDNELDNFMSEKVIAAHRFAERVYVNSSGVSAMEFLQNLARSGEQGEVIYPEVIFIDINMPIMDGFQFIRQLRQIAGNKFANSKLIILTSSIYDEDREKTQALGMNIEFLNKPLSAQHLQTL